MATIPTTNGMQVSDLSAAPSLPGYSLELGNQVDEFYGRAVANASALPTTNRFPGRRVWLTDVKGWAVWDGSVWQTDTAWVTPTLGGSWVSFDGGTTYRVPQYRRWAGYVELRGVMKSGTGDPFTLPGGFRPTAREQFVTVSNTGQTARIDALPTGVVTVVGYSSGASNASLALNGIRFPAEQ